MAQDSTEDKVRLSIDCPADLAEDLRRYVWWTNGETLTGAVVEALRAFMAEKTADRVFLIDPESKQPLEKPAGEPYPPKKGDLRQGRPPR